jgi:hypothetical protein
VQSSSLFDVNSFLETTHKGQLDTTFVLPDPGDYLAQCQPLTKDSLRSGTIGSDKARAGEPWAALELQWELTDDTVRTKMNMPKVLVRQSLMLDLTSTTPPQLDWGTNRNMRLKRLLDVTGLNKQKNFSISALAFATALVHVEHRPDANDSEIIYAEVTRVTSPDKARLREAAQ